MKKFLISEHEYLVVEDRCVNIVGFVPKDATLLATDAEIGPYLERHGRWEEMCGSEYLMVGSRQVFVMAGNQSTAITQNGLGSQLRLKNRWSIASGHLRRYENDGSYRGRWIDATADETPVEGESIKYWSCGDDNQEMFILPPIGGSIHLKHISQTFGETLAVGTVRFRRLSVARFNAETAVGNCPDSACEYVREV